ncbi:DUF305 domain-containing protein [Ilumatobacter sp.]|uniref:DUF305 domain-containing protein n=1 Tax=Ilumatobacter sp. TaxID=1967498 RepID=UPI003AF5272B
MNADADLSLDQMVQLEQMEAEAAARADDDGASGGADGATEPVVLPWWQHPMNIVTLVVTAAILAGMVGWMVGDSDARVQHNDVDTGFLQDMRVHHEQAVLMSIIYRNLPDTDPGLRTVARQIVIGQSIEVGRMIQLLRSFGETEVNETDTAMVWMGMVAGIDSMPGMATDDELDLLGRLEGREADELFVELMTAHHIGGIEMAQFAATNAKNDEVVKMASGMASAQAGEIGEMERLLG